MAIRRRSRSLADLIDDVRRDLLSLARKEIHLARAETVENINDAKRGGISLSAGAILAYAGFLILLLAATIGLILVVDPWLAALIVGGIALIVGLFMLAGGRTRLRSVDPRPTRTLGTLRRDTRLIQRQES